MKRGKQDLEADLRSLIFGIAKHCRAEAEKRFSDAKINITPFQHAIMKATDSAGSAEEATIHGIAAKIGVQPPSLIPPLDSLEKLKYIKRSVNQKDRRKILLELTPLGKKIEERISSLRKMGCLSKALANISIPKQKQILNLLKDLNAALPKSRYTRKAC